MSKASLTEYAKKNAATKPGCAPWIETIPEWPEVLSGWKSGITQPQIRRWLIEERGYDPTVASRSRLAHLSKQYPRLDRG